MHSLVKKAKEYQAVKYIKDFAMNHLLIYSSVLALLIGFSKKSLEILRLCVSNKILNRLRKKYRQFINNHVNSNFVNDQDLRVSNKVWVCWLQGFDKAPQIVKQCILSQKRSLKDKDYTLITEENYSEYIQFPDYIEEKIKRGIISKTHFSDLLRLELLKKYGGTWIDATVYISGEIPAYMTDSSLFAFQDLKPGQDGHCTVVSSWFITAQQNNKIIELTLLLLYEYWKNNNKLIDYYLFHDFFQLAIEAYPLEWQHVIPYSNATPHILLLRLFESFDLTTWQAVKKQTPIHKLSYKFTSDQFLKKDTYYYELFRKNEEK